MNLRITGLECRPRDDSDSIRRMLQCCIDKDRKRRVFDLSTAVFLIDESAGPTAPISIKPREFLDHVLFWNARDLERKLAGFQAYYNVARSHPSLDATRRWPSPADTRWLVPS
jgi:hypothetical protein